MTLQASARNRLPGTVRSVRIEGLVAQIEVQVGDNAVVALITADAARDLDLKEGDSVAALVKSTSVMIVRDREGSNPG